MLKILLSILFVGLLITPSYALDRTIFHPPGKLKPMDSVLKVKPGDEAPDFELPSITGEDVRLSDYRGEKNVILTFVPAAWTPVCSDQWPGYNIATEMVAEYDAIFVGISVDNVPTLWAWSEDMNVIHFPVLSDFWPHGAVADSYGILRTDGMAERAIFIVDKEGIIRFIHVSDINTRPQLGMIVEELAKIQ